MCIRDRAHRFESTDVFNNPKEEPLEKCVERETNGYGADVVIVACPVGCLLYTSVSGKIQ